MNGGSTRRSRSRSGNRTTWTRIRLELDDVALRKSKHFDAEHYARDEAILLRGFGQVISDHGDPAPLPLDTFEIPLEGKVIAETADDRLQITTDRAQYMFTRDR